jgi:hypothetical protein
MLSLAVAAGCGVVPNAPVDEPPESDTPDGGADTRQVHIGAVAPAVAVHVGTRVHRTPRLVGDRLYFLADLSDGSGGLFVAARVGDGFGAAVQVPTEGWPAALRSIAVSADEREIIVEAIASDGETDLFRAVRGRIDEGFGPAVPLTVSMAGTADYHPALLGDELFFMSARGGAGRLYRAVRPRPGAEFADAELVTIDGASAQMSHPWLAADGHTLYYSRDGEGGTTAIYRAVRGDLPAAFAGQEELEALTVAGAQTTAASLGEDVVVFESNRPWSPAALGIWQAKVCRGAACPPPTAVACAGSVPPGQDGRCYTLVRGPLAWAQAEAACAQEGMHLASIHSDAERQWLLTMATGIERLWIGGNDIARECNRTIAGCRFAWTTGEPFLYAPWFDDVNPDDVSASEDCVELVTAAYMRETPFMPGLNDVDCGQAKPFLCER